MTVTDKKKLSFSFSIKQNLWRIIQGHLKSLAKKIGKNSRLISNIIEISDWINIEGFLVTMNIGKAI